MSASAVAPEVHPDHRKRGLAVVSLLVMAMLWGSTFFSIKALVTHLPVADMLAVRFTMALLALGTLAWRHWRMSRATLRQGLVLGLLFGSAQLLQTYGMALISASVSGFVTGLYVVATPLLAALLFRTRIPRSTWVAVLLAVVGLGLLALNPGGAPLGPGELLVLASAILYAGHILAAERFSTAETSLSLTLVQTAVVTALCWGAALPGGVVWPSGWSDWAWVAYLAFLAGALTLFLQLWAQAYVAATPAAVIMATEPVWAAVFAVAFGGESITWRMLSGGGAMLAAMGIVIIAPAWHEHRAARRVATPPNPQP